MPDVLCNTSLTAATGHKGDLPRQVTLMTLTLSLVCMVLDHLMSILMLGGAKIRSPQERCLGGHKQKLNEEQD